MTAKKQDLWFIVFTLIQLVCMTGVIINQDIIIDWYIIGFQAIALMTQIGIIIADNKKKSKKRQ